MANVNAACNLGEQEILNDSLITQKQITDSYNTYAGECVNPQLKSAMLNILNEEHDIQSQIFSCMQSHGWYQPEAASAQQVTKTKQKFNCM